MFVSGDKLQSVSAFAATQVNRQTRQEEDGLLANFLFTGYLDHKDDE